MNHIAIICLIIITGYLIITVKIFGVPKSISDSWYLYGKKGWSDIFSWFIIGLGCLVALMPLVYTYKNDSSVLLVATGAFLCGIGISSNFKDKQPGLIHVVCTYVSTAGAMTAHIVENWPRFDSFLPLAVSVLGLILLKVFKVSNFTFWIEIILLYSILGFMI